MEPPPGGPQDTVPPRLAASTPDSGAAGLGETRTLRFTFSEKMDRQPATAWLRLYPEQRIRKTRWHGSVEAEVELEEPLPADTTVVVELAPGLTDAHKVRTRQARRFPVATADSVAAGALSGVLVLGDSAVSRGVVELYALPPDSLELQDMPLLRRTGTDAAGAYTFRWLPVPGGPWRVRAFVDEDRDQRPGDREAQRFAPDTLRLTAAEPAASAGVLTLYPPDTPGRVVVGPFTTFGEAGPVVLFTLEVAEEDTGWAPRPLAADAANFRRLPARTGGAVEDAEPGPTRLVAFVDVDPDTALGPVPADSVRALPGSGDWIVTDTAGDTTGWYLEPLVVVPAPAVEPGLDTAMSLPDSIPRLVPWPAPDAPADTAAADTTAAPAPDRPEER